MLNSIPHFTYRNIINPIIQIAELVQPLIYLEWNAFDTLQIINLYEILIQATKALQN